MDLADHVGGSHAGHPHGTRDQVHGRACEEQTNE
jgi:hypothetical protein